MGTKTLDVLGKRIGDTVHTERAGPPRTDFSGSSGGWRCRRSASPKPLDDGAIFTGRGFAPLFDQNLFERYFVVRFARGADAAAVHRTARGDPAAGTPERTERDPSRSQRVQQVNWFPYTLAILLGMLGSRGVAARADDERPAPPR